MAFGFYKMTLHEFLVRDEMDAFRRARFKAQWKAEERAIGWNIILEDNGMHDDDGLGHFEMMESRKFGKIALRNLHRWTRWISEVFLKWRRACASMCKVCEDPDGVVIRRVNGCDLRGEIAR